MTDLVGAYPPAAESAVVAASGTVANLLRPDANVVDREGVSRSRIDLVAGAGLLAPSSPVALGGAGAAPFAAREVAEVLAGACGTTWFVVTQHRAPTELAAATTNTALRERWAAALASGDALGAVAFAHLRRPGRPTVRARRVEGGWLIDGVLDWLTSWGLADVVLLMAETEDARVVQALVELPRGGESGRAGLRMVGPVPLAAMGGTHTVAVELDGLRVDDADVADVVTKDAWLAADSWRTPNTPPATFGLARAAVGALHDVGQRRRDDAVVSLADQLADETRDVRARAYALLDDVAPGDRLDERLALRAHAHELTSRATAALVTAGAGGAMRLTSDAQRWAREAMFQLVQAQTAASRTALLERFRR